MLDKGPPLPAAQVEPWCANTVGSVASTASFRKVGDDDFCEGSSTVAGVFVRKEEEDGGHASPTPACGDRHSRPLSSLPPPPPSALTVCHDGFWKRFNFCREFADAH